MVSVQMHITTRTIEYPLTETQTAIRSQPVPTPTTRLAGVGGVHSYETPSSPCSITGLVPKVQARQQLLLFVTPSNFIRSQWVARACSVGKDVLLEVYR